MILCYDIETDDLNSATCRFGCGVTCELPSLRIRTYGPRRVSEMVSMLNAAPLRCGHNVLAFDDPVLSRLSGRPLTSAKAWDLLGQIRSANGNSTSGFKLDAIARTMLGESAFLTGKEIPALIRAGHWHEVIEHCIQDVQLLARLIKRIVASGGVVTNGQTTVRVNVTALQRHLSM